MNVCRHVERWAREAPGRPAVRSEAGTLTYGALNDQASRVAAAFAARGVSVGDRIVLVMRNHPDYIIAYVAALKVGAIAATISSAWALDAIATAIDDAAPSIIVCSERWFAQLATRPLRRARVVLAEDDRAGSVAALAQAPNALQRGQQMSESAAAAILYTSGTTGAPKGVMLSHANVAGNAAAKAAYCGLEPSDAVACFVPLFHCYGQNAVMNATFHAGATLMLYERLDADVISQDIRAGHISALFGVSPAFRRLLDLRVNLAVPTLRYCFSAAAPLAPALAAEWHDATGVRIHEGYGLTESSPFAAYNHRTRHVAGSVGTAIEGVTIRVVDPADDNAMPLPTGEQGEIVIQGPNVMLGYWRQPDLTAQRVRNGWLRTGDIGTLDDDGYLRLVDRLDDMINVSGFKVFPTEIERVLAEDPWVAEAAVYAVDHEVTGQAIEAAIVPAADSAPEWALVAALERLAERRLSSYQRPVRYRIVHELPRNAAGKVLRRSLRHQASPVHA